MQKFNNLANLPDNGMSVDELLLALKDIHSPAEVGFLFPLPPIIVFLAWALVLFFLYKKLSFYIPFLRSKKARVLHKLDRFLLKDNNDFYNQAKEVSETLRRVAILKYGKEKIAPLYGKDWIDFVCKNTKTNKPEDEVCFLVSNASYAPKEKIDQYKKYKDDFFKQAKVWIEKIL